jgi:GT2 family glycosyltransferase
MISLIIPAVSKTKEYTDNILDNIREIYPNEDEVEIVLELNDQVTLSENYNNAVARAKGNKIILLHNDMVLKPGFIELMDKAIQKNIIISYTRVEPPTYLDIYPGKEILDCGIDLKSYDHQKFLDYPVSENITEGGSQIFFGCLKEDYIKLDGNTFKMFCEDDDLHLRYKIGGFKKVVSPAQVYHFVSKTSRTGNYQNIEQESNINFIKKWGFRNSNYNVVYKKKLKLINNSPELENTLNIWFNGGENIIVEVDGNKFTQEDYYYIQQLNDIIKDSGEIGEFELGNLKIRINSLESFEQELIKI